MRLLTLSLSCLFALVIAGCGQNAGTPAAKTERTSKPTAATEVATPADPAFLLTEQPADPVGVGAARKESKDEEEVTIIGRIGGSTKPFIEGMAAFTIVDPKLDPCPDDEGCPTPWDYCCTKGSDLKGNTALVKLVSGDGTPVAKDARNLLGVKELTHVVVHGKAKRDEKGNLTVVAEKVFVKKD
ncbi:MAG: hypothetical protein IT428_33370 [Planctomycetaceae bacterium]|nr:hypothetical protein [Planctomycetaceae bacterium]